ncbi:conjugative transposon protein TraN [Elizabethkingia ursingii]|uniref:Conjugative transposon protein TraN n=1 Tax=Elizabethkingia ursingii TaxID=1756150 RepID=A0ABX3N9T6_9FLAO|nr:conjugative transposon protein TraN [Elizabethkingia ursingii]
MNNHLLTDSLTSHSLKEVSLLDKAKIEPYWLTVTYDKTSHLIFPSKIRYVDLGSEYLSAGKADGVDNVLRIKAAVQNFEPETNFSVITEDGKFYSFDVFYSAAPAVLTYDLLKMKQVEKQKKSEALFGELEGYSPSVAELIMETIYQQNKKIVKNIDSDNYGIAFSLKGIYVHQGKLYFHTALNNKSNHPFIIDAVNFSIVNKKTAKKTILQDQTLTPLRTYKALGSVLESSEDNNVFMLDQFTLTKDKLLLIEIYEKNGDRNQLLKVKSSAIIKPEVIMF